MKFKNTAADYQSTVNSGKKMGFAPEAESFLMDMMSDGLYSDKYGSIVREIASNCIDANVEAGCPEEPVCIRLEAPNSFSNQGHIEFSDSGIGISPARINDIFTLYFASTKRDGNDMIGGFGIGAKSPFAYSNVFTVTTVHNGWESIWLMEKRGQDRTCTMIEQTKVDKPSGTTIRIPIKDSYDYKRFVHAVNEQCLLMRPLSVTMTDGFYKHAEVVEFENFYVARDHNNRLVTNKVALGNVVYPAEFSDFHPSNRYHGSFSLIPKLEIGEVMPTMSRESLQITDEAREYITRRFQDAINELQQLINNDAVETDSIVEAFKYNSNKVFTLPGTDIEIDLSFGSYDTSIVKKEPTKLRGFEGDRNTLRSYLQGIVRTSTQYAPKSNGNGMTWRTARTADSHRYQMFITGNERNAYNDKQPLFIRWKPEDKLSPADKEYIEQKFAKSDYTSIHFIERTSHEQIPASFYAGLVGGMQEGESSTEVMDRVYDKYGKRILVELMGITDSIEDWRATEEFVQERKERLKAARKQVTKKDRAKDSFRLRGIGRCGVYDFPLKSLQGSVGYGILYLNSKQLEVLKDEHKNSNCSWQSFEDYVHENYETGKTRLFHVSEKTYKAFNEMQVFSNFAEALLKKAERKENNDYQRFVNRMHDLFYQDSEAMAFFEFATMVGQGDKSFNRTLRQVNKQLKVAKRVRTYNGEPTDQTVFKIGQQTVSIEPILKLRKVYLDLKENKPFLHEAMVSMRTWHARYNEMCKEALTYVFPNKA